jgi:hypothetical protein
MKYKFSRIYMVGYKCLLYVYDTMTNTLVRDVLFENQLDQAHKFDERQDHDLYEFVWVPKL